MSIIKNEIPILEFDTGETAVINPTHEKLDLKLPKKSVFAFLGEYIEEYARGAEAVKVSEFLSMRHLKKDKALPNQSFDVVIVRVSVLMMLLAAISGILFVLTDTRVIRSELLADITSNGIAYFAMLGFVAFLNKPLAFVSYKIVKAVSHSKDLEYVTNCPTIIIRSILLAIGVALATVPFIISLI